MNSRYKLARVDVETKSTVYPITTDGQEYAYTLCSFENNDDYYFAIYENMGGDAPNECWSEYDYFGQDLDKAIKEYNEMIKGE